MQRGEMAIHEPGWSFVLDDQGGEAAVAGGVSR